MINYIKKFGVFEYVFFAGGLLVFATQIYRYIAGTIERSYAEAVIFILACLLMSYPRTLAKLFKKKVENEVQK
jgi:membrane protein CcdC involved in cytochrome C biogenesis